MKKVNNTKNPKKNNIKITNQITKPKSDNQILKEKKAKITETANLMQTVKSKYILKKILSILEEKTKLNIIKHNKKYQNLLEIDIVYYKSKSGKYRIMDKNGNGKEYTLDDNKLLFEGNFKKGKKCGKGKEYDTYDNKVTFEGTYLNGKRNGKGKEFEFGHLIFQGEYLNGKRHGKGIVYDYDNIVFEGTFSNGYKIEGKEYYNGKLEFEGKYKNGERNGKGKEYYSNGKLAFEGEYKNGKRNGKGKEYDKNGKLEFEGEFKDGDKWIGKENGKYFQGEYLNGKKWNGKGREYKRVHVGPGCTDFISIESFKGEYVNGNKKGKGEKFDWKNKKIIETVVDEVDNNNQEVPNENI